MTADASTSYRLQSDDVRATLRFGHITDEKTDRAVLEQIEPSGSTRESRGGLDLADLAMIPGYPAKALAA